MCHVRAVAAFWQLNGTVYSELNSDYFESRGITSYDVILGPAHINKTLTVVGSPLNNNTIVNCIAFEQLNAASNTSGDAVITILGKCVSVVIAMTIVGPIRRVKVQSLIPYIIAYPGRDLEGGAGGGFVNSTAFELYLQVQ